MLSPMLISLLVASNLAIAMHTTPVPSPFFIFSTAQLHIPTALPDISPATPNDIHHSIITFALSTCPTKHYIVINQPGVTTSDYEHASTTPFLSMLEQDHPRYTGMKVAEVIGQVDVTGTINTILMDCLHHGITRVEQIDITAGVPQLDQSVVDSSILYANLPTVDGSKSAKKEQLRKHDAYLESVVDDLYSREDFTVIYVTEARQAEASFDQGVVIGNGAEVPLVQDSEQRVEA